MPSMDIVSELNKEEARNACENAQRELDSRFDFRGVEASFEWKSDQALLSAEGDFQLKQMRDILRAKCFKRGLEAASISFTEPEFSGKYCSQKAEFKEGIDTPLAKKLVKLIKDSKLKVQSSIQGEQIRVTGKKRDDLQQVIALVKDKQEEFGQPFQFTNFRD